PSCVLVDNPGWEQGMGTSLRAGLEALAGTGARAALVSLVGQPGIGEPAVARALAASRTAASLTTATYSGVRGPPVLLSAGLGAGVAASAAGVRGARAYLREHGERITAVEGGDVADPHDIDTEAVLARLE